MGDMLIAIGGTGQHTALAVSRLVFLGVLPKMRLAVIDAENSNDLSLSLSSFGGTVDGRYGLHPLDFERIHAPFDKAARKDPKFQDLFLSQNPLPLDREVFELSFDEVSAGILVDEGMFGRPSVGATIFSQNKYTQLADIFEGAQDAEQIFVTGSMVGGTGAGIIHQLVSALPKEGKRIYGIVFLRWFNAASGGKSQTISDMTMERNMRYGLDYFFKDTRPRLKASLLIGMPDKSPPEITPITVKAGELGEKSHYFHLLAAYGLSRLPKISVTEQENGSVYAASYEDKMKMYDEVWGNEENAKPLSWYVNRALFVQAVLNYAGSDHFVHEVEKRLGTVTGLLTSPADVGTGLHSTIRQYKRSVQTERLKEMAATWRALAKQYEFSLTWLDKVLGRFPDVAYLPSYKEVKKGGDPFIAEVIQTLWREPLDTGQEVPPAPVVARQFHRKLVEGFKAEGLK
ncbi:MAG TPA: hypothetical protein VK421_08350 [Pyrinomonadaceae bacterium]|nr:hypothetical protein [Pyrinomonadaceae bacterium]